MGLANFYDYGSELDDYNSKKSNLSRNYYFKTKQQGFFAVSGYDLFLQEPNLGRDTTSYLHNNVKISCTKTGYMYKIKIQNDSAGFDIQAIAARF